jgi:hypothetical protein
VNTLEIRPYDYILWRAQTPQQVRDRLYPCIHLSQMNYPHRSTDPQAAYCMAWMVDGSGIVLVELTET